MSDKEVMEVGRIVWCWKKFAEDEHKSEMDIEVFVSCFFFKFCSSDMCFFCYVGYSLKPH